MKISFYIYLAAISLMGLSLRGMQVQSDVNTSYYAGQFQEIRKSLKKAINLALVNKNLSSSQPGGSEIEKLFFASENLLKNNTISLEQHPLYQALMSTGQCTISLKSGPTIENFTDILLVKHNFLSPQTSLHNNCSLTIFDNAETYMRALDIFVQKFQEKKTDKSIVTKLSFELRHTPLDSFCIEYVKHYPELITMSDVDLEKFIKLLSVFCVGNDIVELLLTMHSSIVEKNNLLVSQSFKPIALNLGTEQKGSNEISLGQQNLDKQIQNLNGSELAMPYIKDADGKAQFEAFRSIAGKKDINFVDLGGGRGETNALIKAVQSCGSTIHLLNIEPYQPFGQTYIDAHNAIGVTDVAVWLQSAQQCSVPQIIEHFKNQKVDVLFASHSLYFILGDLHKIAHSLTEEQITSSLQNHPLWKYFEMLSDDGVFIITLQSGAGARLYRNAILGKHGLDYTQLNPDEETTSLLSSFGNMGTFLRHFELFQKHYYKVTGKKIDIKMHYAMANVPLGNFEIKPHQSLQGYVLCRPLGQDQLASKMLDFYGNWNELETLITMTPEKIAALNKDDLKKLGLESADLNTIIAKQTQARQMQEIFVSILRVFAPAHKNMQHPNIVLEIRREPEKSSPKL